MERKNALVLAHELTEKGDWVNAYDICIKYEDREDDDDSWELLKPEEGEELVLVKIECIIRSIALYDLSDKNNLWKDKHDKIIDLLHRTICELSGYVVIADCPESKDDPKNKIESFYEKVDYMAQQHFYSLLDEYIAVMCLEPKDSFQGWNNYINGYHSLQIIIYQFFKKITDIIAITGEDEDNFNPHFNGKYYNEAIDVTNDKLFNKALIITKEISEMTNDFPYFDNYDASYRYIQAIAVTEFSLIAKGNENTIEQDKRIVRLKHKINLCCDYLNAIYVVRGQRVSLCMEESERQRLYEDILACEKEIREFESGYSHPQVNREKISTVPENNNTGGCYVATAVYGSYDCPQVWTLRRYRDDILAKTWYGRVFIKIYYAISPTLVKYFGNTKWFKRMWKGKLDNMVSDLQTKGVESTPYRDKEWK